MIVGLRGLDDRLRSWGMIGTRDTGHDSRPDADGSIGTTARDEPGATTAVGPAFSERLALGDSIRLSLPRDTFANRPGVWVRGPDGDVLVVLNRDTRSGQQRDAGRPPKGLDPGFGTDPVALDARLERLPHREAMYSWGLSRDERAQLLKRGSYLRVTGISSKPHQP